MWAKYKNNSGFTIVELLIVIVVIAILAAISIVAYNGIQNRANTSKVVAQASAYIKGLKVWEADVGAIPIAASCIAPAAAVTNGTTCPNGDNFNSNIPWDAGFNTTLNKYSGTTPTLGQWGNNPVGSMWYISDYYNDKRSVLEYAVAPNADCGLPNVLSPPYDEMVLSGAKFTARYSNYTICMIEVFKY